MKKQDLDTLIASVSSKELQDLITIKEKMELLEDKKQALDKRLKKVLDDIEKVRRSIDSIPAKPRKVSSRKKVKSSKRKKVLQPSLPSLMIEILKENKKPQKINEICDILLTEKKYRTKAKNFKNQIRVILYKNEKGYFKKAGPGLFALAKK